MEPMIKIEYLDNTYNPDYVYKPANKKENDKE